jgi:hypothetical protein
MRRLATARAVVDHLGGLPKVASITDTNISTAKNWPGRAGSFPASTYVVMSRALRRRKATAHPRLWNMRGV